MMIATVAMAGLLAMAPDWAIVDIPYPEPAAARALAPEGEVTEAIVAYVRAHSAAQPRRSDILELKIEGPRATARVVIANHTETMHLEYVDHRWRVVKAE